MAQTGEVGNINAGHAYASSFGYLPHGTVYTSVDMKSFASKDNIYDVDLRKDLLNNFNVGLKALTTISGGAGTAGYALIPIYVDPLIVDRTRKWTPLVELVPRRSNMGITADYNVITAKGGAFTAAEDASLAETNTTYLRQSVPIKYLYSVGRVTGPAQAAVPPYMLGGFTSTGSTGPFGDASAPNAMQLEVINKTREIRELEENLILNGDTTNPTEFDGLIRIQGTTNRLDKGTTGVLGLDDINGAIKLAFNNGGRPSLGVCGSDVYTDLLNLLTSKIGYLQPQQQVFWGFSAIVVHTMVGSIPVIPSMFMTNAGGAKALYFFDMSVIEMRVLQDLSYKPLAHTNDSDKFFLKIYEAIINKAPTFSCFVGRIA